MVGTRDAICRNLDLARDLGLEHIVLNPWYTIPGRIHETSIDTIRGTVETFVETVMADYID